MVKRSLYFLLVLLCSALAYTTPVSAAEPEAGAGAVAVVNPVCNESDFVVFLEKYSLLSLEDQMSCIQFPVKARDGAVLNNSKEFAASQTGEDKLILSRADMKERGFDFFEPYFYTVPESMLPPEDGSAGKYGYVLPETADDGSRTAVLTEGGTGILTLVQFIRSGEAWRVIGFPVMNQDEEGEEEE